MERARSPPSRWPQHVGLSRPRAGRSALRSRGARPARTAPEPSARGTWCAFERLTPLHLRLRPGFPHWADVAVEPCVTSAWADTDHATDAEMRPRAPCAIYLRAMAEHPSPQAGQPLEHVRLLRMAVQCEERPRLARAPAAAHRTAPLARRTQPLGSQCASSPPASACSLRISASRSSQCSKSM